MQHQILLGGQKYRMRQEIYFHFFNCQIWLNHLWNYQPELHDKKFKNAGRDCSLAKSSPHLFICHRGFYETNYWTYMCRIRQSSFADATHVSYVEIINLKNTKTKLIDKIFYSLGRTTIPISIVNIIVVGTYLKVGGDLPLNHRIKWIGPVNRIGKLQYTR